MSIFYNINNNNINFHHSLDANPKPNEYKMHTHLNYELFYFISGKGTFYIEGNAYPLNVGDILIMRSTESHYIAIDPSAPYERCVLHFKKELMNSFDPENILLKPFENRPAGKLNLFRHQDFENENYLFYINNILNPSLNKEIHTMTNLFSLLNEILVAFDKKKKTVSVTSEPITHSIVSYINNHLYEPLSLDIISESFYISKPQLCRIFKASTGCSVWDYITVKRVTNANNLISLGMNPTEASTKCGFSDYSVFFRAYKKHFGHSPKLDFNSGIR